jgi:archaellum component FlaD/FlaE
MGKIRNFSGQPIFNQLIKFIDKSEIRKIAKRHSAERYVKKFTTYDHVVVMLFVALEG